jgi:hypothetical protein
LLPEGDPAKADLTKFPSVHYNNDKKRYEDSGTGMYYDPSVKGWRVFEGDNTPGMVDSWYTVSDQSEFMTTYDGTQFSVRYSPTGIEGWQNYLRSHNMLPPGAPS